MSAALGLTIGTRVEPRQVPLIFSLLVIPMTFLGAVYYPWNNLAPLPWLKIAVLVNPLIYMSEGCASRVDATSRTCPSSRSTPRSSVSPSCSSGSGSRASASASSRDPPLGPRRGHRRRARDAHGRVVGLAGGGRPAPPRLRAGRRRGRRLRIDRQHPAEPPRRRHRGDHDRGRLLATGRRRGRVLVRERRVLRLDGRDAAQPARAAHGADDRGPRLLVRRVDGGAFAFGDASFFGSMGGRYLAAR